MIVVGGRGGILEGARQEVEGVEDYVLWSDLYLGEVVVENFDGVEDEGCLGGGIDNLEAAVVLEGGANGETSAAAVVLCLAGTRLGVDDDRAAERGDGRGVEVERAVNVFPGVDGGGDVGLAEEVECQLGLSQEFVPQEFGECGGHTCED